MLHLTLHIDKNGIINFNIDHPYLRLLGELLTTDVANMPDFVRAIITSPDDEELSMDACNIKTENNNVLITHLYLKELPKITLPKNRMLEIIDIWENFFAHKRPIQLISFKEEEFGLQPQPSNITYHKLSIEEKL
ncbi:MAG: hypothetical protein WDZ41_02325 [Candidatus Babeliales bacterium]